MIASLGVSNNIKKSLILKTGQTTEYGSGTGADDGFYMLGVEKSYSVLTTGQYSGAVNIILNGKTDVHSNNCVIDNNTGKMWSRYASSGVGPLSDGAIPWTTNANGEGIFPYCVAANGAMLGGYSDWRIPNIFEIASIMKFEGPILIDVIAFPSWPIKNIWTSTSNAVGGNGALVGSFSAGTMQSIIKTSALPYVALVRN